MANLEKLKIELEEQKNIILAKGGQVNVANDYPSPYEITSGIKTIITPDFTLADATEDDVALGKTFFSNSNELKTGTGIFQSGMINHIFMPNYRIQTTTETITYEFPEGFTEIRPYSFYYNYNPIHIVFNPEIETINKYAFNGAENFTFEGFGELKNLKLIDEYGFAYCTSQGVNYFNLPSSVTTLGSYCFYSVFNEDYVDLVLHANLKSVGGSCFMQPQRKQANSVDLTECTLTSLSGNMLYNWAFKSDLVLPEGFKTTSAYCNYNGTFKNMVFPSSMYRLESRCFGSDSSLSLSSFILETVTFLGETPPTFGANVFALQNIQNGFKIYVPDNSIEEYKAISNLSPYLNCIYPMSEKE